MADVVISSMYAFGARCCFNSLLFDTIPVPVLVPVQLRPFTGGRGCIGRSQEQSMLYDRTDTQDTLERPFFNKLFLRLKKYSQN
jgi:hypothetical protein